MNIDKCVLCDGEFYTAKMTDNKCDACNARFPGINSKEELLKKRENENSKFNEGSFDNRVTKKVYEILEELGILVKCDCGEMFYKRSPAQKTCGNCKNKETE